MWLSTQGGQSRPVLIDTWWNVNLYSQSSLENCLSGFNRYMVECELINAATCVAVFSVVLIDTWWNVNSYTPVQYRAFNCVLIDTWWNVNTGQPLDMPLF